MLAADARCTLTPAGRTPTHTRTQAVSRDDSFQMELDALDEKHRTTAQALLGDGPQLEAFMAILQEDFKGLRALLRAISFGAYSARVKTTLEKP